MLFENDGNGHEYLILDEQGDYALLAQLYTKKFVVVSGLGLSSWQGGSYHDDIHSAYADYKERIS